MAEFKKYLRNSEQAQFTNSKGTSYIDEGLSIIGLKLSEIDKDEAINIKHNGKFLTLRKKLFWARKSLGEQSVIVTAQNLLTYFDVRASEAGDDNVGILSMSYQEQFEFVENLTQGFNQTQLSEGSIVITKNNSTGNLDEVKLYKMSGSHTANTITLRVKDITANESISDTVLATITTESSSSSTLTATINNAVIGVNKHLYIHATQGNADMSFIIVIKYSG